MSDEKAVYARDVCCPKCDRPLADVAPDYRLDGGEPAFGSRMLGQTTFATCASGHKMFMKWERDQPLAISVMR